MAGEKLGDDLRILVTYFEDASPAPSVTAASAALAQVDAYLKAAWWLGTEDWDRALSLSREGSAAPELPEEITLEAITMGSPMTVVILVAGAAAKIGLNLVELGERVATFGPRVKRAREEDKLATEEARLQRQVLQAQADAFALSVLDAGPPPPYAPGPSKIEILRQNGDSGGSAKYDPSIAAKKQKMLKDRVRKTPPPKPR